MRVCRAESGNQNKAGRNENPRANRHVLPPGRFELIEA
jgi:hypothetical protein